MPRLIRSKIKEWARRYSVPLIAGYIVTILVANGVRILSGNFIIAAFCATWADNAAFYGTIAYRDLRSRHRLSVTGLLKVIRNMIFEFGPAELLDSFALRPFYLSVFPYLMPGSYSLAVLLGSVLAEVTYFIPVILFYETRKKVFRD